MQKNTNRLHLCTFCTLGASGCMVQSAPLHPRSLRAGAGCTDSEVQTCKDFQVVKNNKKLTTPPKKLKTGLRGEKHPKAVLTDHEVELMRVLHERDGIGYRRLVRIFLVPKRTVRNICNYRCR